MSRLLKQSTAKTFRIGPFLDSTDGVTAETGLTIAQADIQISKNGGAFAQTSDAAPTTTHDSDGWYQCPLTATDTGTLGPLTVQIVESGALPVWEHFIVVPANVYDSIVSGTDNLQTDAVEISGDSTAADNAELFFDGTGYNASNSTIGACTTNTDMRGTDSAALASVCTEARLAELDAANLPTDVAAIPTNPILDTEDGSSFTAQPWNAAWDGEVQSECTDALVAYDPPTKAELDSGFAALNDVTAAEVKTAMEATGSDLDLLMKGLVNKLVITEATGAAELFNDAGASLGSIASCFTTDGTYTTRKRLVV